uniref:(northern house mosquito) hypothetical protein n=1 Tax=Culex pipiens TaxID=7175 RepID=A0A8D7ZYW4_CULPI
MLPVASCAKINAPRSTPSSCGFSKDRRSSKSWKIIRKSPSRRSNATVTTTMCSNRSTLNRWRRFPHSQNSRRRSLPHHLRSPSNPPKNCPSSTSSRNTTAKIRNSFSNSAAVACRRKTTPTRKSSPSNRPTPTCGMNCVRVGSRRPGFTKRLAARCSAVRCAIKSWASSRDFRSP